MAHKRKITVNGKVYQWVVGGLGAIVWDDTNKQHHSSLRDLTGLYWDVFERGQYKKNIDGMIVPYQIEHWIRIHILHETPDIEKYEAKIQRHFETVFHQKNHDNDPILGFDLC